MKIRGSFDVRLNRDPFFCVAFREKGNSAHFVDLERMTQSPQAEVLIILLLILEQSLIKIVK